MNLNLTHNEHLRWRLVDQSPIMSITRFFGRREHDEEQFKLVFGDSISDCKDWATELTISVDKLVSDHGTDLAVFYSGGSDSEVVIRTLLALGIKPEVHIIQFADGLNEHEVQHAFKNCEAFGLEPHVWHHDAMRYIKDDMYLDFATKYQCSQIAYLKVLEYAKRLDKPVVMGGEIYLQKHQHHDDGALHAPTSWYYVYREDEDGVTYRYSYDTGHPVINEFFTYTPNLLYSWLTHPRIKSITNNEEPGKITLLSIKARVYEQQLGYALTAKNKFHGYEALTWANRYVQQRMREILPRQQVCKYEYNQLINDLCTSPPSLI